MRDLSEIRKDIDVIDAQMKELYEKRLQLACQVAEYKIANHKAVFDKAREEEKLEVLTGDITDEFVRQGILEFFSQIMSTSRKKQYQLMADPGAEQVLGFRPVDEISAKGKKVIYQGVEGAYSQAAMFAFFPDVKEYSGVATWREAVEMITKKEADYAVLPIENSTAGMILENYDLLAEYDVAIVGQQILKINHALLGNADSKLEDIREVYSHKQALNQCAGYIRSHGFASHEMDNTAMAAKFVAESGRSDIAAIGGRINSDIYGLSLLDQDICDLSNNETRFIIISADKCYRRDAEKISLSFVLPHESGSLYKILSHFIFNGLNMTAIESRPLRGKQWEYRFFLDFEGNLKEEGVRNALRGIKEESLEFRILGNY